VRPVFLALLLAAVAFAGVVRLHAAAARVLARANVEVARASGSTWTPQRGWLRPHSKSVTLDRDTDRVRLWREYANGYCAEGTARIHRIWDTRYATPADDLAHVIAAERMRLAGLRLVTPARADRRIVAALLDEEARAIALDERTLAVLRTPGSGLRYRSTSRKAALLHARSQATLARGGAFYCGPVHPPAGSA
jgi:hypothetical protein